MGLGEFLFGDLMNNLAKNMIQSKPLPQKRRLVVKAKSLSSILTSSFQFGESSRERYQVFDNEGVLKYRAITRPTVTERDILDVYDAQGTKIGYIKEHVFSERVPGIESRAQTCSVYLCEEKIATFRYSVEKIMGIREHYLSTSDCSYNASCTVETSKKHFKIHEGPHLIADINQKSQNFKKGYIDRMFVEYYSTTNENIVVLLSLAIDLIS